MNPSTAAAAAIVDAIVEAGVREVVLCPGSRSAPIAYAVRSAERAGRLRLHVRVDERSAGFLALGLAKRTGVPAVVVTTSGTAVANLHPAVLEAHHARVPLIVLSADRPAELRGSGANQTTTQPGIFAGAVRAEADLEPLAWLDTAQEPDADPGKAAGSAVGGAGSAVGGAGSVVAAESAVEAGSAVGGGGPVVASGSEVDPGAVAVRSTVLRLISAASGGSQLGFPGAGAGPVHLNVQFREPLVPAVDEGAAPWPSARLTGADRKTTVNHTLRYGATHAADPALTQLSLDLPERTLVVIGDLPRAGQAEVALAWAARLEFPVVAEPFGPYPRAGVVQHGVLVLGDRELMDSQAPKCVVVVGRPTLSRPVSALVRRPGVRIVVVESGLDWSVPGRDLERVPWTALTEPTGLGGFGAPRATPNPPTRSADGGPGTGDWASRWFARGRDIEASLVADPPAWPSGAAIARTVVGALPEDALLFVGSSNAPRDLDTALGPRTERLDILASRGLAGIDGCVSTAVGLALAEPGRPAYALMGDLTFLHDANGLLIGPAEPRPDLTIVVVNDDGGGIFHVLEPGEPSRAEDFERLFGTPTGTDLGAVCRAHGIRHTRVETAEDLAKAVAAQPDGVRMVEIVADRSHRRAEAADLRSR